MLGWLARRMEELRGSRRRERGFTLIELLIVVVIIGILAAIAVPTYLSQQNKAKDTAAKAQLRTAATAQQLYYAEENTYATNAADLEVHGFRQGDQRVEVKGASGSAYCMEAPGGGGTFKISAATGKPEPGTCPP